MEPKLMVNEQERPESNGQQQYFAQNYNREQTAETLKS